MVANGEATVPQYGQLTVEAEGETFVSPLGGNGGFYFENLPVGVHRATVEYRGPACELVLEMPASTDAFVVLGELECDLTEREDE